VRGLALARGGGAALDRREQLDRLAELVQGGRSLRTRARGKKSS
jgi:hypothetical protein